MKITKYGHACLLVEEGEARILVDPGGYSKGFEGLTGLNAVLITHQHGDHLSVENIAALAEKNPGLKVFADEGSYAKLDDGSGLDIHAVHAGEEFDVAGVKVKVVGTDHAVIHPTMSGIPNVGYLVARKLFIPGDNFTLPGEPVDVLAFALGAPWSKISEAIDYVLAVHPTVAIPYHDAVLAMPDMYADIVKRFTEPANVELRVVLNGQSTEV